MRNNLAAKIEAANTALMERGEIEAVAKYFAPDYVAHLTETDMVGGHAAIRAVMALYRRAFPDMQVRIDILATEKNRIAWQRTVRATHQAGFKGFPATGRPLVWRDMVTSRFRDGKIAEEWVISDLAERLLLARKRPARLGTSPARQPR